MTDFATDTIPSLILNNNCFNKTIRIFSSCDPDFTFEELYLIWELLILKWNFCIFCALSLNITVIYLNFVPNINMYGKSIAIRYIIKTMTYYAWHFVIWKTKCSTNFLFIVCTYFEFKFMIKFTLIKIAFVIFGKILPVWFQFFQTMNFCFIKFDSLILT